MSGSGKTTLILESLIPGLEAEIAGKKLPGHVKEISAEQIRQVKLIDATPIGINVRSTVATYANVHDELRKVYARTPDANALQYKAGDFSYNTDAALSNLRWNGKHQFGCSVPAGCGNPLPGMPGIKICQESGAD